MAVNFALYQIALYDSSGTRLAIIDDYRSFQFQNTVNGQGFFTLIIGYNDSKRELFELNGIIQVKRKIPGVVNWYTEFEGRVENFQTDVFQNGNEQYTVVGSSFNGTLAQRIIAYYEGTSKASKNDSSESVMKEYVLENIGASATVANGRIADGVFSSFSVEADGAAGINWEGDRSGKNLLDVLQEISNFSEIDFKVETNATVGTYIFRTYVNQLGDDRTTSGLDPTTGLNAAGNAPQIFSPERGNVQKSLVAERHRKEKNRVFVYGQGTGATRSVVSREDATAFNAANNINLRETMRGGGSQSTAAQLNSKGDEILESQKALQKFTFIPNDVPSSLYGVHYFLGDKVTVKIGDTEADKKIVSVTIDISGGQGETGKRFEFEDIPR